MSEREPKMVIVCPLRCGGAGDYDDNVFGPCARCGQPSYWRPHAPPYPKICGDCWWKERTPEDINVITPEVRRDLRDIARMEREVAAVRRKVRP